MSAILHLVTGQDFLVGVVAGSIGLATIFLLRRWSIDWGIVFALAVVGGVAFIGRSAWLDFSFLSEHHPWAVPAALVAAGFGYAGVREGDDTPFTGLAFAVSIGGIWATVPETDRISVVVGVTAIMIWVWWPYDISVPHVVGSAAIVLLASWAVLVGGIPRSTGLVGGFGAIVSLWVSARFVPKDRPWLWIGVHTLLVLIWSRWAGLSETVTAALVIGIGASLATIVAGRLMSRSG